jgi:hypothetical protein
MDNSYADLSFRYTTISPVNFRKGDIVEVQLTVTAIRVKNNRTHMLIKLRTLTLLDSKFTEVGNSYISRENTVYNFISGCKFKKNRITKAHN